MQGKGAWGRVLLTNRTLGQVSGRADGRDLRCRDGSLLAVVPEREDLGSSSEVGLNLAAGPSEIL